MARRRVLQANVTHMLHVLRGDYSPSGTAAKLAILEGLDRRHWRTRDELVRQHAALLFLCAFPDSARVQAMAREHLVWIAHSVKRLAPKSRRRLTDSGIAGSLTRYTYPLAIAEWLAATYPREIDIDWPNVDFTSLDALLRTLTVRAEDDLLDAAERSPRQWLHLASGRRRHVPNERPVPWLLRQLRSAVGDPALRSALYTAAQLPLVWRLHGSGAATRNELVVTTPVWRTRLRSAPRRPLQHIATLLPEIALLSPARARDVIALARAALSARAREVHAVSYANPMEVWWCDLGEGVHLAVIGVQPAQRMSLEANYAWLMVANGVPIGYGGVTALFHQANTGINIFDPFRQSEGAFLWTQCLRAFHTLFGVRRFLVNADQFGAGNDEAIRSGAFWFYYKLGFRPADAPVRKLAEAEWSRMQRRPSYRSSPPILRSLAAGDLHLTLPGFPRGAFFDEQLLVDCSAAVTSVLADENAASRSIVLNAVVRRVRSALGVRDWKRWPTAERDAFVHLAPVLSLIPSLAHWPARERRSIIEVMRAKGRPQEREFVQLAREHPRFQREIVRQLLARSRTT